jgi:hypothetical protein
MECKILESNWSSKYVAHYKVAVGSDTYSATVESTPPVEEGMVRIEGVRVGLPASAECQARRQHGRRRFGGGRQ